MTIDATGVRTMGEISQALFPVGLAPSEPEYRAATQILARIALFSSVSTRLALLRVNYRFFDVAGAALYDTVYIDSHNWLAFFRGSLTDMGIDDTLSDCALVNGGKTTLDKCRRALTSSYRLRDKADMHHPAAPKTKDVARSFKAHLLKYVRVLTVGSHHVCHCERWGKSGAHLFPNVQVLRIAPCLADAWSLHTLCDNDALCHFITTVRADKIVFRNLDGTGFPFSPLGGQQWRAPSVTSVVLVLPTDGRRYACFKRGTFDGNFLVFDNCLDYRIVLHGEWEDNSPKPAKPDNHFVLEYSTESANTKPFIGPTETKTDNGSIQPLSPDDLCIPLGCLIGFDAVGASGHKLRYRLYGLEGINFAASGTLVEEHQRLIKMEQDRMEKSTQQGEKSRYHFVGVTPSRALETQGDLHELVRGELRIKSLSSSINSYYGLERYPGANLSFLLYTSYMRNTKGRHGELDATD